VRFQSGTEGLDRTLEMTRDFGESWTKTESLNDGRKLAAIQPTILSFPSGELRILCRTRPDKIAESRSWDQGLSWSRMELISLPNPDSGIDALILRDGVYSSTTTVLQNALHSRWESWTTKVGVLCSHSRKKWASIGTRRLFRVPTR